MYIHCMDQWLTTMYAKIETGTIIIILYYYVRATITYTVACMTMATLEFIMTL